jgi:hypothetical protein
VKERNCGLISGIILMSKGTEENHKNLSQNSSNLEPPEYMTGITAHSIRIITFKRQTFEMVVA